MNIYFRIFNVIVLLDLNKTDESLLYKQGNYYFENEYCLVGGSLILFTVWFQGNYF